MCVFGGNVRQFYLPKIKGTFILSVSITSQSVSTLDWSRHQEYEHIQKLKTINCRSNPFYIKNILRNVCKVYEGEISYKKSKDV